MARRADSMHRIIVATDGSTTANRAIDAGAVLAKCTGADLVLLTIGGSVTGAAGCRPTRPKPVVRLVPRQSLAKTRRLCTMRCYGRSITCSTCPAQMST